MPFVDSQTEDRGCIFMSVSLIPSSFVYCWKKIKHLSYMTCLLMSDAFATGIKIRTAL